jgi:hypothetical protein
MEYLLAYHLPIYFFLFEGPTTAAAVSSKSVATAVQERYAAKPSRGDREGASCIVILEGSHSILGSQAEREKGRKRETVSSWA